MTSTFWENDGCPASLLGCHIFSPDEIGFDLESKTLEYFCDRCGALIRQVPLAQFQAIDYEILYALLTRVKSTEENISRHELMREIADEWQTIVGEGIEETVRRVRGSGETPASNPECRRATPSTRRRAERSH